MPDDTNDFETQAESGSRTKREEYRVTGDRVVSKLKELLHEGTVRHVVIKNEEGRTLIELPVTVGVAGALLLPVWAAVGAVAAVVTKCSIEVERDEEEDGNAADDSTDVSI